MRKLKWLGCVWAFCIMGLTVSAFAQSPPIADDPANELIEIQKKQQAAYDSINRLNPFSKDYGKPKDPSSAIGQMDHSTLDKLEALLSNRAVQSFLKFFSSPTFALGIEQVVNSPNKMWILYTEIAWFIFLIFFRAWKTSKLSASNWIRILWLNLWTFAAYAAGTVVIPWIYLGAPYYRMLQGALQVFLK